MHQKMNPKQHGFRSGRSCLSHLLVHHNKILEELEKSNNVDVIYLGFAKTFDKIDHGILLNKLKKITINGKIGVWIHNFLSNRQQCVAVNGTISSETRQEWRTAGVSVIAPPIPNTYIWYKLRNSGLNRIMLCWWYSNPSRNKIWKGHTDAAKDLHNLYKLEDANNMKFNANKF